MINITLNGYKVMVYNEDNDGYYDLYFISKKQAENKVAEINDISDSTSESAYIDSNEPIELSLVKLGNSYGEGERINKVLSEGELIDFSKTILDGILVTELNTESCKSLGSSVVLNYLGTNYLFEIGEEVIKDEVKDSTDLSKEVKEIQSMPPEKFESYVINGIDKILNTKDKTITGECAFLILSAAKHLIKSQEKYIKVLEKQLDIADKELLRMSK